LIPDARVFLSHSSRDKDFARHLAEDLKRHGATVWLDEAALEPGGRWKQQLKRAISDNDFVVVVLTPASVHSKWVKYEVDSALSQGAKEGRVKLIPLLFEDCDVPRELRNLQLVDFTKQDSYEHGLKRLVETFERSWTRPRHQRRPWTKKNLRLALRAGLLRDFNGQLVFGPRVAERSRTYGARWLRGRPIYTRDRVFNDWKEYAGLSLLHAVDQSAGLTDKEEVTAVHECHERLLDFYLDLATRVGVLNTSEGKLKLSDQMAAEMQEWIPRLNELGFIEDAAGDGRAAVTMLFVELIRERLIERIPEMSSFAEALGIVIHHSFGFWTGWSGRVSDETDERGARAGNRKVERKVQRARKKRQRDHVGGPILIGKPTSDV
jgi:hypothetical protein